jgi:O-acetyl-ADP-ribose deacetylase (regulator of RNase III)
VEIRYTTGDAVHPDRPDDRPILICHVVNNSGGWGNGFVVPLGQAYPLAEQAYRAWHRGEPIISWATPIPEPFDLGETQFVLISKTVAVANMCAQNGYKSASNPVPLDYDMLQCCLEEAFCFAINNGANVAMPRIGAGRGGGDWARIEDHILRAMEWAIGDSRKDLGQFKVTVYDLP